MGKYNRRDWRFAALVTAIILILGACTLTPGIPEWGDDHAAYINEGIAIAEGRFEEQIERNYAYHPSDLPDEADNSRLVYVWGYPLILSLVYRAVGFDRVNYTSVIWYKLIPLLSLALTGGVLTLFLRRRFSIYTAAGAALVFCMSGNLFEALNTLYSDPLFLFFSILTLWLMEVFVDSLSPEGGSGKSTVGIGVLYAISLWMTYETRLSGFTVCAVALLGHAIAILSKQTRFNRQNWWLHLAPYILFWIIVLVTEHLWLAPATPNISDLAKTTEENIPAHYWKKLFDYFDCLARLPFKGTGWVFLAACVIGIILKGFNRPNLHLTLLLVGTLAVVFSLPYKQGLRYFYNVLPLMVMYVTYGFQAVGKGICKLWKGASGTAGRVLVIALAVEILFFSFANQVYRAGYNFSHWNERFSYDVYSDEAKEMYRFIQEELPEDAVIAFGKPRAMYLNTGRTSFKVGVNGHEIGEADYYLKHRTMGFEDVEVETDGMEIAAENDMFTLYKVVEGK